MNARLSIRAIFMAAVLLPAACPNLGRAQSVSPPPLAVQTYAVDEKGTCRDDLVRLIGLRGLSNPGSGLGYTFVMNPALGLSRTSALRSEGVQGTLRRFEIARVMGDDPSSGKALVRTDESQLCGWIGREALLLPKELQDRSSRIALPSNRWQPHLLFGPPPLQVKDGPAGKEFPGSTLTMKVVVQNVNRTGEAHGIPVFEEPGSIKTVDELSLFDIFEVFVAKNETQPANARKGYYYLVGKRGGEGTLARIHGWLHDDDVQMWNSRMAAFWSESGQALGYGFADAAERAAKAERERKPLPVEPVFRGPMPEAGAAPDQIAVRRFPIISQDPGFDEVSRTADVNWFKIAVRGLACKQPAGSTGPGRDCMALEDVDATRIKWQKVIESMSRVDILFVIDATSSMNVYFPPIAEAVRAFAKDIRQEEDVNVGVVVYGDYRQGIANVKSVAFERLVRLHNPVTEPRLIDALARYKKIAEDPLDNDLLEAPFAALINAAATLWRPEAGLRLIVHIADAGNRDLGQTSNEYTSGGQLKSTLRETVSIEMVEQALKAKGITYLPIAVAGQYNEIANKKFRDQASDLIRRVNLVPSSLIVTYDEKTGADPEMDRSGKILARLKEVIALSRESARALEARLVCERSKALKACTDVESLRLSNNWIGRFAAKISEELLPKNQIENIFSRTETVTALHFPPMYAGKDVLTYWLAIEPGDLASLVGIFQKVCDRFSQGAAKNPLYDLIEKEIGASAGEYKSVGDLMDKRFFVPAAFIVDFLRKPWAVVESELADPKGFTALQRQVCRSAFLLDRVLSGKRVMESSMEWNDKTNRYIANTESDFQWRIKPETGIELYYVPLSYMK